MIGIETEVLVIDDQLVNLELFSKNSSPGQGPQPFKKSR